MEKGKISALQMALILYPAIIATAVLSLPSITASYAKNDLWLSPIIASSIGFLTVFIAVKLHDRYPGKTVIQLSEEIVGKIPGKVISFLILAFYIHTTGDILRSYSEFIVTSFLFKTPEIVVVLLMILLCAFCIYGGLEVLARSAQFLFPVFILPLFFLLLLLIRDYTPGNLYPVLEKGLMPPVKGAIVPAGWYAEIFLIMFLLPFLSERKKGMKYGMITVLFSMLGMVAVNLAVLFVLGATTSNKVYPLINVARYADIGRFFQNMEAVVMAVWIVGTFVKISIFYYVSVLGTAQWLNLSDYRPIVWPLGIIIVQLSFWGVPGMMDITRYDLYTFPFYSTFIQTIIPLFLLIIAAVWKKEKSPNTNSSK